MQQNTIPTTHIFASRVDYPIKLSPYSFLLLVNASHHYGHRPWHPYRGITSWQAGIYSESHRWKLAASDVMGATQRRVAAGAYFLAEKAAALE